MRLEVRTHVGREINEVFQGFTIDLFKTLRPPVLPFQVERFDGCYKGDRVHINMGIFGRWHALVVEQGITAEEIYFVDIGESLPFPLKKWRHLHRIIKHPQGGAWIVDAIEFSTGFRLLDLLMRLPFFLLFALRRPRYREAFGKP